MPTLRTRAGKGSDLTPTEADANFKRTVTQKTTTYACLVSDNNAVIEGNHAITAFTITLGDAATMLAAETGSYVITITNIGAAVVTVAPAGSDTINGSTNSLTLDQYATVTLQVVSAGDGYETIARTGLNTKIVEIGDWDMDATASVNVAHGLTYSKIRTMIVMIRDNAGTSSYDFSTADSEVGTGTSTMAVGSANCVLNRSTDGYFDNTNFDSTSFNRGWITIQYTD